MKKAIQQTLVARRRPEVRGDRREQEDRARDKAGIAGDNFHAFSDGEETESETEKLSASGTVVRETEYEAEARLKLRQHGEGSTRRVTMVVYVYSRTDRNPSKNWRREQHAVAVERWITEKVSAPEGTPTEVSDRSSGSGRFRKQSSTRKRSSKGKAK